MFPLCYRWHPSRRDLRPPGETSLHLWSDAVAGGTHGESWLCPLSRAAAFIFSTSHHCPQPELHIPRSPACPLPEARGLLQAGLPQPLGCTHPTSPSPWASHGQLLSVECHTHLCPLPDHTLACPLGSVCHPSLLHSISPIMAGASFSSIEKLVTLGRRLPCLRFLVCSGETSPHGVDVTAHVVLACHCSL